MKKLLQFFVVLLTIAFLSGLLSSCTEESVEPATKSDVPNTTPSADPLG